MTNIASIALPTSTFIRNHDGQAINVVWGDLTPDIIAQIAIVGAKTMLTNVWNGGGKDRPDSERADKLNGKLKAWYAGDFEVRERADSMTSEMRECYILEQMAARGQSRKQAEKAIGDIVTAAFGEKEKATFDNLLKAIATGVKKAKGDAEKRSVAELVEALTAKYEGLAKAAIAERAEAAKGAPVVDFADFDI